MKNKDILLKDFISVVEPSDKLLGLVTGMSEMDQGKLEVLPHYTAEEIQAVRDRVNTMVREMTAAESLEIFKTQSRSVDIEGPAGRIPLNIIEPEGEIKGGMLHIHGGGFFCGSAEMNGPQLVSRANKMGLVIASVEYRLAPENPYPAAPDDCEAAALWWVEYVQQQYGVKKVVVGGESAGGHLAAVTSIRMRQKHGYKFAGSLLTFGVYDLSNGLPSRGVVDGRNLVLDSTSLKLCADLFVTDREIRTDPDVSPIYADLSDMPPALFTVGELDPLLDDSILLATKWLTVGNKANLVIYRGAPHGFSMLPSPEQQHHEEVSRVFIKRCLEDL